MGITAEDDGLKLKDDEQDAPSGGRVPRDASTRELTMARITSISIVAEIYKSKNKQAIIKLQ